MQRPTASWPLFVGFLKLTEAQRLGEATGRNTLRIALTFAGIASVAFGVGAFFLAPGSEMLRTLLMLAAAIEGVALLAFALRGWPQWSHAPRRSSA